MTKDKKKTKQKVEKIDPRTARQIEILKKHYVVDTEKKIINVDFCYDSASDIFRDNLNLVQVPMIEHELIDNVTYFFDRIPEDYQIALNYQVSDIEDYTPEEIAEAYFDELELDHYLAYKRSKKIGITTAILTIVGCICILFSTICYTLECFSSINGQIIGYIIDSAACAFIWEALGILFLYKDEEMVNNQKFLDKLNSVSFSNKDGEKVVSKSKEEITKSWVAELRKERIGTNCFLITGTVLIILGAVTIISLLLAIKLTPKIFSNSNFLTAYIIHFVLAAFEVFGGIGCISRYRGKGALQKAVVPTMIVLAASVIVDTVLLYVVLSKTGQDPKNYIVSSILSLLIIAFMIYECIYFRKKSKKKKK